jgi:hypothetical protein
MNTIRIPHPDEERSFHELRSEFRAANQERIVRELQTQEITVGPLTYRYQTDARAASVDCTLTEDGRWLSTSAFPRIDVPERLLRELEHDVEAVEQDLKACLPEGEGVDHDGPPLFGFSEDELLAYAEALEKE